MGAINNHNVCTAVVESLNASVDLLLVAFDGSQSYRVFTCASDAFSRGGVDMAVLARQLGTAETHSPDRLRHAAVAVQDGSEEGRVLNN